MPKKESDFLVRRQRALTALLWLAIVATVLAIYREAGTLPGQILGVALLFVFGAILALCLTPVIDRFQSAARLTAHRGVAVVVVYAALLIVLGMAVALLAPLFVGEVRQLPAALGRGDDFLRGWGIPLSLAQTWHNLTQLNVQQSLGVLTGVVGTAADVTLVVVISLYLSIDGRALIAAARQLFHGRERWYDFTLLAVGSSIGQYLRGQLVMSAIIGVYTGVALFALGIRFALVLAALAFLLEFLPIVGALISMAIVVLVALTQSPQLAVAAAVAGALGHIIEAYVVGPRITARATRLHPLVAIAALVVGAEVGGILGALFAVPLAACANIMLGAGFRARRGNNALTTHPSGKINKDSLPRLGEEIGGIPDSQIVGDPVPRKRGTAPSRA